MNYPTQSYISTMGNYDQILFVILIVVDIHSNFSWNTFDATFGHDMKERLEFKDTLIKIMNSTDGVYEHGRIGQKELLEGNNQSCLCYAHVT